MGRIKSHPDLYFACIKPTKDQFTQENKLQKVYSYNHILHIN